MEIEEFWRCFIDLGQTLSAQRTSPSVSTQQNSTRTVPLWPSFLALGKSNHVFVEFKIPFDDTFAKMSSQWKVDPGLPSQPCRDTWTQQCRLPPQGYRPSHLDWKQDSVCRCQSPDQTLWWMLQDIHLTVNTLSIASWFHLHAVYPARRLCGKCLGVQHRLYQVGNRCGGMPLCNSAKVGSCESELALMVPKLSSDWPLVWCSM